MPSARFGHPRRGPLGDRATPAVTVLLVVLAVAFAWSMGAHYTGACMGMPHALGAVKAWQALVLMAPLAWLGATVASHGVEHTVADRLTARPLGTPAEIIAVGVAFALTTAFTQLKIPTSTIQILVFAVAGAALGARVRVTWPTIGILALVWAAAPLVAASLGFGLTRILDRVPALRAERPGRPLPSAGRATAPGNANWAVRHAGAVLGSALVVVGAAASFVMGSNDVANATGSLVATRTFSPLTAGLVGGGGLALGVITWGRPLLGRVAFDIVKLDRPMATAAQAVQAIVVISAVSFGFFTSMNQALIGAMAGAGAARGRHSIDRPVLAGIIKGWVIGPGAGIAAGYLVARAVTVLAGPGALG
jgi:PiT family inorganic phosphate transporter